MFFIYFVFEYRNYSVNVNNNEMRFIEQKTDEKERETLKEERENVTPYDTLQSI